MRLNPVWFAAIAAAVTLSACSCDSTKNCTDGAECDDGDPCTVGDVCTAGECVGSAVDCRTTATACRAASTCDPNGAEGNCAVAGQAATEGTACTGGSACVTDEKCANGACGGGVAVDCSGTATACREASTCDPNGAAGNCAVPGAPIEDASCDDHNPCTSGERCSGGTCGGGTGVDCSSTATACREASTCDPSGAAGNCAVPGAPKNEGQPCGWAQACSAGACAWGACVARSGTLEVLGLEANNEGGAAWNTHAGAPEPTKVGHAIDWTPTCVVVAYYYFASRDWVDTSAVAALHVTGSTGFDGFNASLAAAGRTLSEVKLTFGLMTLEADVEGVDWSYDTVSHVETRYYTGGQWKLKLNGEDMVGGDMPRFTILSHYNDLTICDDDSIEGHTDFVIPQDLSASSSNAVKTAAAAFLRDVGAFGVRLVYDSLQPVGQTEFTTNNRQGAYFEAQSGRFEIGSTPIAACQ